MRFLPQIREKTRFKSHSQEWLLKTNRPRGTEAAVPGIESVQSYPAFTESEQVKISESKVILLTAICRLYRLLSAHEI
jgi:hypothetical protein